MKATKLIEELQREIKAHGDREVLVRGSMNGTFGNDVKVRLGKNTATSGKICVTGDFR